MNNTLINKLICIPCLTDFRGLPNHSTKGNDLFVVQKYFDKDSVENFTITYKERWGDWAYCFASRPIFGVRINPLKLEPFVARYVNAINSIGSKTCCSCDGWHKDNEKNRVLYIIFKDRYSRIWHKIMSERYIKNDGIVWRYEGNRIEISLPQSDTSKIDKYITLNKRAEIFEKHSKEILLLKQKMINKMKGEIKNSLSDELIEKKMREVITDILTK